MTFIKCNRLDNPTVLILVNQNTVKYTEPEGNHTRLHFVDGTNFVITHSQSHWDNDVLTHSDSWGRDNQNE